MKVALFDTETTGFTQPSVVEVEKQPRIIEIGLVIVESVNAEVLSTYSQLIYPEQLISEEITKVTGIKNEDLEGKPKFHETLAAFEEQFVDVEVMICHNAPFDTALLQHELERCARTGFPWPETIICTVQEYQHEFGYRPKMTELYERKLGRPLAQTHRALDDVMALHEILKADHFYAVLGA